MLYEGVSMIDFGHAETPVEVLRDLAQSKVDHGRRGNSSNCADNSQPSRQSFR